MTRSAGWRWASASSSWRCPPSSNGGCTSKRSRMRSWPVELSLPSLLRRGCIPSARPSRAASRSDIRSRPVIRPVLAAAVAAAALVSACAHKDRPADAPKASKKAPPERFSRDPFPSTYRVYPGAPTLISNVTIFDGEGGRIDNGSILFADGKVVALGPTVEAPAGATVIDGKGKWVTPGIIDVHSHLGDYPSPSVEAHQDGNEVTGPVHPDVWAEHSVWPQDPGFSRALANGGVTALQILPGSANLFGGRSVTLKNVPAVTTDAMKFPGAPYGLKMACGENPKRTYGTRGQSPMTNMANVLGYRKAWIDAVRYAHKWDCYRADEMATMLNIADEFGYRITMFHHAVEAYKVAPLLAKRGVCSAIWAERSGTKMEAIDGIGANAALLQRAGACVVIHSDDTTIIQRLNQETAIALGAAARAGIPITRAQAIAWITANPARALGIAEQTGTLERGKMADVVLWSGDPFSSYTLAE